MSRLGNYSEPDCRTVPRIYDAGNAVVFRLISLRGVRCRAAAILSNALGAVSSRLSNFRVYPRKSDPG